MADKEVKKPSAQPKIKVETELKYRYQFDSWEEFSKYNGPKG